MSEPEYPRADAAVAASDLLLHPVAHPVNAPCLCGCRRDAHAMDRPPWPCLTDGCWCYEHGLRARPWWTRSPQPLYFDFVVEALRELEQLARKRRGNHDLSATRVDDDDKRSANELVGVAVEWALLEMFGLPLDPVRRIYGRGRGDGGGFDFVLPGTGRRCEARGTVYGSHLIAPNLGIPPTWKAPGWDVAVLGRWATKPGRLALLGYATPARFARYRKVERWKRAVWAVEQCALADLAELFRDEGIALRPEWTWAGIRAMREAALEDNTDG